MTAPTHLELVSHVASLARGRGYETRSALARAASLSWSTVDGWWGQLPQILQASTLNALCHTLAAQPGELITWELMPVEDAPISCEELAQRWRVPPRIFALLAARGAIHGQRRRGRWRFTEAQITDYIYRHTYPKREEGGEQTPPEA